MWPVMWPVMWAELSKSRWPTRVPWYAALTGCQLATAATCGATREQGWVGHRGSGLGGGG
ncbi:hypothetical protein HaLaN_01343 [Haematococcus lacustris]|uniref:Uncharacterized protein n=1 Tax=Haematococcus lacustris TaxID=44745 RepID=A0A699YII6_HAELA|nr:hypothetical protein HaLaN_01343 [Haematococcus lacustris]